MTEPATGWLALGLSFSLLATGGRRTPLDLSGSPSYRASWGLPWTQGTEQTDAWVLCGAPISFAPGAAGRVVIAPVIDLALQHWRRLRVGDALRAFEGAKVVGSGQVRWIVDVESSTPTGSLLERFRSWVGGGGEPRASRV
ncbi:hypothetical protein GCM10022197_33180 [Microlunatus spumicola]|uniref:Uncharacterized protein n=1 Tax=Microlunatus spumicola TaxID=81499 RepID=A0ABP6XYG4_9ACTN